MAMDMFMEMGAKIKGEAKDKVFGPKGGIDILAWSWGLSQSGGFHSGGGGGAGKANFQDLSFTKYIDKASTPLQMACALGSHIAECKLTMRKAGEGQQKFVEITMTDCLVTSYSTGGSGGEDRLTENCALQFAKIKFEYFTQDAKGAVTSGGIFAYDIQANVKTG